MVQRNGNGNGKFFKKKIQKKTVRVIFNKEIQRIQDWKYIKINE